MKNKELKKRIIDISYEKKLSHLGSCLSAVDIIDHMYRQMNATDTFVLSSGHAGLALYVVLEKHIEANADKLFDKHGVHPNRDTENGIEVSSGSLGQGLPIAVGIALADRERDVYCLISDGECAEGSIWEALRIAREQSLTNLKVYLNLNGYGAYRIIDRKELIDMIGANGFPVEITETHSYEFPFLDGLGAHYYVMNEEDYILTKEIFE